MGLPTNFGEELVEVELNTLVSKIEDQQRAYGEGTLEGNAV